MDSLLPGPTAGYDGYPASAACHAVSHVDHGSRLRSPTNRLAATLVLARVVTASELGRGYLNLDRRFGHTR
jgi:hypothetical protein